MLDMPQAVRKALLHMGLSLQQAELAKHASCFVIAAAAPTQAGAADNQNVLQTVSHICLPDQPSRYILAMQRLYSSAKA